MKKIITLLISLFIVACLIGCNKIDVETMPHSDDIVLGLSKEQVEIIAGPLNADGEYWVQSDKVKLGEEEATVSYRFIDDELKEVRYNSAYTDEARSSLVEFLEKKYDEPISYDFRNEGNYKRTTYWAFTDGKFDYVITCHVGEMELSNYEEQVIIFVGKYEAMPDMADLRKEI